MDKNIVKFFLENQNYYIYLKENSEWVNILRREPYKFNDFIKYVKKKYKLRPTDKVNNYLDKFNVLSNVLSSIK